MVGRFLLKKNYVSYVFIFLSLCFISGSVFSHQANIEPDFLNQCKEVSSVGLANSAKPLKQVTPSYPRRELLKSIEANILAEFKVNKEGKVIDPIIVWQSQSDNRKNKFNMKTLASVKKYQYEPARNENGEVIESVSRVLIKFRIEGLEDNLTVSNASYEKILYKLKEIIRKNRKTRDSELVKVVKDVDAVLKDNKLSKIDKAVFYYLKAVTLKALEAPKHEIRKILLESKKNYELEIIETLKGGVEVRSVTSEKLNAFVGILLAESYFKDNNYMNVEHELVHLFDGSYKNDFFNKKYYSSWVRLGVSSYNLKNWCNAFTALKKAKELSEREGKIFPPFLEGPLKQAKSQANKL